MTLLSYFQCESEDAFEAFRADEETQEKVESVIGPYGPKPRVYDIVFTITA